MSLDLYERETAEAMSRLTPAPYPEVGVFDGFLRGTGLATMRGLAKTGRAIDILGAVGPIIQDAISGGTEAQDRYFREHEEIFDRAVDYWTPKPREVGAAAEIAGTLLSTLPLVLASPPLAVGSLQLSVAEDLMKQGVDPTTAQLVGATQAAGLGLGIYMPIFGRTLAQRLVFGGAGFNVLQGMGMRGAGELLLEGTPGAGVYDAFDPAAITLDALLGLAFGGITHFSPAQRAQGEEMWAKLENWARSFKQSDIDALSTLRQAQHKNVDSMPGKPMEPIDLERHTAKVEAAIEQLMRNEPVAVDDLPAPRFEPDAPRLMEAQLRLQQLAEAAEEVRKAEGFPPPPEPTMPRESEEAQIPQEQIINPIDRTLPQEQKVEQLVALSKENQPAVDDFLKRVDEELGTQSKSNFKAPDSILAKANRPSIKQKKPWFDVEHVRDSFRFKTVLNDIDNDLPRIAELLKQEGWSIVKVDTAKLADPLEWGWRFVALDLRMPNGQIVEYYMPVREMEAAKKAGNHTLFEKWRGRDLRRLSPEEELNFVFDLAKSRQGYDDALTRYYERTGSDEAALRAAASQFSTSFGSVTGLKSSASSSADGMASRPFQAPLTNAPKTSGGDSTTTTPASDLDTSAFTDQLPPASILAQRGQEDLTATEPEAPAATRGDAVIPPPRGSRGEAAGAEGPNPLQFEAERFVAQYPDLPIRVGTEADGTPILTTTREYLEGVKADVAKAREDVGLFEAAATCLLGRA